MVNVGLLPDKSGTSPTYAATLNAPPCVAITLA